MNAPFVPLSPAQAAALMAQILASPGWQRLAAGLAADHDRFVTDLIALTEIPAPPFAEGPRAAAFAALLAETGIGPVERDAIGNVTALRPGLAPLAPGQGGRPLICLAAHLDTVFPAGTDCRVRRAGTRLMAPGIGDDTRGLALLLAFARALGGPDCDGGRALASQADLLFVADVGEEGAGDLRGIRHLFTEGPYAGRITAFISFDGIDPAALVTGGIGARRQRIRFAGPGGHSLNDFGTVNPAHALAQLVTGLAALKLPRSPRTTSCVSVFGGGSAINAIPQEAWVDVDLRSEGAETLAQLDRDLQALVAAAVAAENQRGRQDRGPITAQIEQIGNRPAGLCPPDHPLIAWAEAALRAEGFTPQREISSTDANIPLSLGIPAVTFGTGGLGGGAHSLQEWVDVTAPESLRGLRAGLALVAGIAGLVLA